MPFQNLIIMAVAWTVAATQLLAQSVDPKSIAAIETTQTDWDVATQMAEAVDTVTADTVLWLRLRAGAADFATYDAFLKRRADWPGLDRVRQEAELLMGDMRAPADVIDWFGGQMPRTGEGAVRLAQAHFALDQPETARDVLRSTWTTQPLTEDGQAAMLASFGAELAPLHDARLDYLLWRGRTSDAARMLALVTDDMRALATARIGYINRANDLPARVAAVPAEMRTHPGLAYARYAWLAGRGERTDAVAMLLENSTSAAALGEPFRWSGWRRVLARWEMREGRAEQAYKLAANHFLTEGASYADLEWLAGYLSLVYLGNPTQALTHFENGLAASSSPISLGRMHYWIGRTHAVKGNADLAAQAYAEGAAHQTSFYGLLASEKVGRPLDPAIAGTEVEWRGAPVFENEIVQAALILLAGGERGAAFTFFAALGRSLDANDIAALGAFLADFDEPRYTLLLGKAAVERDIMIPAVYFPVHELATLDLPVSPALALSIARRESEFNETIGSPAGALGLMQVMPATAEEVAGNLGLPYARARLTNDWQYNATIGAAYLAFLEEEFGPSPVMIAAGYNAGPSRPRQWMDERGDPRLLEMDVVDWIEHIPFRETRNYVMRVTESIPVYEARLTGQTGPISFTALLIGEKPLLRPRARPEPVASDAPSFDIMRPIARP